MVNYTWAAGPASIPVQDTMGLWVEMDHPDTTGANGHLFGQAKSVVRKVKLLSLMVAVVVVVSFGPNKISVKSCRIL